MVYFWPSNALRVLFRWLLRHGKSAEAQQQQQPGPSRLSNGEESGLLSPNASVAVATPSKSAQVTAGIENKAYDGTGDGPAAVSVPIQLTPAPVVQQQAPPPVVQHLHMHADSQYWLIPDCTRPDAERLLSNKADGTFLIRRSAAGSAPFALSIAYHKVEKGVGHILIHRSERGFGFTEPYLLFPTLNDLVVYYAGHSLEEHNSQLTTTLAHPLGGPQPDGSSQYSV